MMESQATLITDDDDQPDTMRATINRGELLHELRHLCRTADTRQFAPPICACVQMEATAGEVRLTTTDHLETYVTVMVLRRRQNGRRRGRRGQGADGRGQGAARGSGRDRGAQRPPADPRRETVLPAPHH